MNPIVTTMGLTAIVVVTSRWSQGKPLDVKVGVGAAFAAIALTGINAYDPAIAKGLAAVILISTLIYDGPPLFAAIKKVTG